MSSFPDTPTALLTRLAADAANTDEAAWRDFFELYEPAMRSFLYRHACVNDAEDMMQEILLKLANVLRQGGYRREVGLFRSYLATMLYNEVISHVRKTSAYTERLRRLQAESSGGEMPLAPIKLDVEWRMECHAAAVRHVMDHTALAERSKRIFRALEESGGSCEDVARQLHEPSALVRQVKCRVGRMVSALERKMGVE